MLFFYYNEKHLIISYHEYKFCFRCFGVWKRRFPIVALTMRLSLLRANAVITATAVLHNICRLRRLSDITPEVEILDADVPTLNYNENNNQTGTTERDHLITQYFNK